MNIKMFAVLIILVLVFTHILTTSQKETFEQRRTRILNEISMSIEDAIDQGKYECCIDPPCTMCYLGDWVWDDGTCDCDGMILDGDWDNVCPQCIKGMKEGKCISKDYEACSTD